MRLLEGSGLGAKPRDNLIGETTFSLATNLDCDPKGCTATYTDIRVTVRAHTEAIPTAPTNDLFCRERALYVATSS